MVAALSSPVRALEITGMRHGAPVTRPVTLVLPNRNLENSDRSRGVANGGTPSGSIGFSREPTPDQRRLVVEAQRIDVRVLEQAPAVLRSARSGGAGDAGFALTYGSDGRLPVAAVTQQAAPAAARGMESVVVPARNEGRDPGNELQVAAATTPEIGRPVRPREGAATPPVAERRVPAVAPAGLRNGEVATRQPVETAPQQDPGNALIRERVTNAYRTVPQAPSLNVSLFA